MKGKYYSFLILIILFVGCLQNKDGNKIHTDSYPQNKERNKMDQSMEELKIIVRDSIGASLLRQLKVGSGISLPIGGYSNYAITEQDFSITQDIIDSLLVKKGLKKPNFEDFRARVNEIFNVDIRGDEVVHLYVLMSDRWPKDSPFVEEHDLYEVEQGMSAFIIHLDGNRRIVSKTIALPNLIDYQKLYPDIARVEDTITTKIDLGDGEFATVDRWKDFDLEETREMNMEELYHKNAFLFNGSRASLIWLLNDDKVFMSSLLKTFGYDKEPRINELVLEGVCGIYERQREKDSSYDYDDLTNLLFSRGFNGNLRIHHGMLATIKELTTMENTRYYKMLGEFLINVKVGAFKTDLSDEEKVELFCTFGRTELDILKKYPYAKRQAYAYISSLLSAFNNYEEIASRHDYWNIRNFEDIVKVAEWEYPISSGLEERKMFFDYTTLE